MEAINSPMEVNLKNHFEDKDIRSLYKDILSDIQSTSNKISQYHTKFTEKEVSLHSANQEIDRLNKRCLALEAELKTLKESQCKNCTRLKKVANEYRKKSMETEGRLKLITNIISNSNKSQNEAYSLATQALLEGSLQDTEISEETKENPQEFVPSSSSSSQSLKQNLKTSKGTPLDTLPVNIINHDLVKMEQNEINNISQEIFLSDSSKKTITESKKFEHIPQKVEWKLKKVNECGNKLKQTKLSLTKHKEKKDISTLTTFNGGVMNSDEMKHKLPEPENDLEETFFEPAICSTEVPNENLGSSPILKKKKQSSPNYKYRRDAVRKKADRMRLPGQDCQKCAEFYENPMLENIVTSKSQTKNLIHGCSRHRDKYPIRQNTPEGFWDPLFEATLEN